MNVKEVGIQFQQWEVKALLDGRKTRFTVYKLRQPCQVGDVIWVRETWQNSECFDNSIQNKFVYRANEIDAEFAEEYKIRWNPSIHMPREAARLFLKVKSVKVKKLQDITEEEAKAEGCGKAFYETKGIIPWHGGKFDNYRDGFRELWDNRYKNLNNWYDNPWVWVIEFEILRDYKKKESLKCKDAL